MPEESSLADAGFWFTPALTLPSPERAPSPNEPRGPILHRAGETPLWPRGPSPPVLFGSPPLDVPWIKPEGRIRTFALPA